ncbi:hypothetical protein [Methanobrevibacter sp.]|uniref:hypothetical protein n=1 Tax=Methanobrevibacter sp. TaxID=66852 RepID=UPI0039771FCD
MLYDKYNIVSKNEFGIPYSEIISSPKKHLNNLLLNYRIDDMIDINYSLSVMSFDRVVHIMDLYLAGQIFFQKIISCYKEKYVLSGNAWELLSLVHDISYYFESVNLSSSFSSLEDICKRMKLIPFFSNENVVFYSAKTYHNYFNYKREQFGICDHGIIASLLFENKYSNELITEKKEIAYVIASHNIFVASRHNISLYEKFGLFELIPDDPVFNCIAEKNNPYAFLYLYFCLLDILEPINAFDCTSSEEVFDLLNSIDYDFIDKSLIIKAKNKKQLETIAARIFDIPIWLKVGLNILSDDTIIITMN